MWLPILILLSQTQAQEIPLLNIYWKDAQHFFDEKKFDQAILPLQKLVNEDPTRESAYILLGKSLFRVHRYEESLISFRKALDLSSQKGMIQIWIGRTYAALKRWSELRLFSFEIEKQKNNPEELELAMSWMKAKAAWELKDFTQLQKILSESEKRRGDFLTEISLRLSNLELKLYSCDHSTSSERKVSLDLRIRQDFNLKGICLLESVVRFIKLIQDPPHGSIELATEPDILLVQKEAEETVLAAFQKYKVACQKFHLREKGVYAQTLLEKTEFDKEMRDVLMSDFRGKQKEALSLLTGSSHARLLSLRNGLKQL